MPRLESSEAVRDRLRGLMSRRGIGSPTALAREAGLSPGGFLLFWRTDGHQLRNASVEKLAHALRVSIAVFLGEEDDDSEVPAVLRLTVALDPEDFDVFAMAAVVQRVTVAEIAEMELALASRRLSAQPEIADALDAIGRPLEE